MPLPVTQVFVRGLIAALLMVSFAAPAVARAIDEKDLLPVDEAFALGATAPSRERIAIDWKIADGYYLYRHRISVQPTTAGFKAQALQLPGGEKHTDEFFGKVETYRMQLRASLPGVASADADTITLKIKYQGCADLGICYPPQTRLLTVALPASAITSTSSAANRFARDPAPARGILDNTPSSPLFGTAAGGRSERLPLPPEQAFAFEAIADGGNHLLLRFTPARGYYLYRDRTSLALDAGDGIALERPRWPRGQAHRDEHFGEVIVYFDQVEVPVALRRTTTDARRATLTATFQGCQDDGICYPPMTREVVVTLPIGKISTPAPVGATEVATPLSEIPNVATSVAPTGVSVNAVTTAPDDADGINATRENPAPEAAAQSARAAAGTSEIFQAEDTRIAASLSGSGRWLALLGFFGFGLLLAFTPCVLPMIPILSGIIAGRGERIGARRAFSLSFVYVFANAVVFTIAGVIAGLLGANLQVAFQTPWVIVAFAAVFVALALSMFGLYELQLPARWRSRMGAITDKQSGGSWAGVAAMGALSALIVGPCVAPPLAAVECWRHLRPPCCSC